MNIVDSLQFSAKLYWRPNIGTDSAPSLILFWQPAGCPQISETSIVSTKHFSIDMHKIIEAEHLALQ